MSLFQSLLLLLGCFAVIWFYQGRQFWQRWQRFRAWELAHAHGSEPVEHQPPVPQVAALSTTSLEAEPARSEVAHNSTYRPDHERAGGAYRADGVPTFKAAAPQPGEALTGAGTAMATPPSDLRISIAEMDRRYPKLAYLFPIGWSMPRGVPELTACAFVRDVNHALVTGFTDSGKDSLINSWLYALAYRYGPTQLQLAIIDGKNGLSMRGWYDKEHVWLFAKDAAEIEPALQSVRDERLRREKILWDARCENWEEFGDPSLPLLIVYVSELLVLESILGKTGLGDWLNVELSACRAAGIRFIIGAQTVSRMDTRWRGQCGLVCAGYQKYNDADEPNTGLSTKALLEMGTTSRGVVAVPPSALPIPPGGAGVFTLVQGRTVLTVRAPRISRNQREWWLAQLPDRAPGRLPMANRSWTIAEAGDTSETAKPWDGAPATPMHEPGTIAVFTPPAMDAPTMPVVARAAKVVPPMGYDPDHLARVLQETKQKDLPSNPLFVDACVAAYGRHRNYKGVVVEFWGDYTGDRSNTVKQALANAAQPLGLAAA